MSDPDSREDDPASRIIITVAGNGDNDLNDESQLAINAALTEPQAITLDQSDNIYLIDNSTFSLRKIDAVTNIITTIISFQDQIKNLTHFQNIWCRDLTYDAANNRLLFITLNNIRIHCFNLTDNCYSLIDAMLYDAHSIVVDKEAQIYISEGFDRHRILRVDSSGKARVMAGRKSVQGDFGGDQDLASRAAFRYPTGLAFDRDNNLHIADSRNHRIRRIDAQSGIITTVAGNGKEGWRGDGKLASTAALNRPMSIAFDEWNNLYIADTGNNVIRRVDAHSGIITTIAGDGEQGLAGDNGPAQQAQLNQPHKILFDHKGELLIADRGNHRIRKIKS